MAQGPLGMVAVATLVLDAQRRIIGWSPTAEELFGYRSDEALGRDVGVLLGDGMRLVAHEESQQTYVVRCASRRDGEAVRIGITLTPLDSGAQGPAWLLSAAKTPELSQWATGQALLAGLTAQSPVMIAVYDTQARVTWFNTAVEKHFGWTVDEISGRYIRDLLPQGEVIDEDGQSISPLEKIIEQVLRTGTPVVDVSYRSSTRIDPHHEHIWSCSYFRMQDPDGKILGVCETTVDVTDRYVMRRRLAMLSRAGGSIGQSLDIVRTASDLADLVVPEFADAVTVDLVAPVLAGGEPGKWGGGAGFDLRRVAERAHDDGRAGATLPRRVEYPPDSLQARCLSQGRPAASDHVLAVPMRARGAVLGLVMFDRRPPEDPFGHDDLEVADELVSRTAVCVDNGRRYAREHDAALTLQRALFPLRLPQPPAVTIAHRYLPAPGQIGVGGDWYDVIPLSGARVGLVVGDVVGHGVHAAATMGRIRTTVAALAALDLPPDELLARLDDLVVAQSLGDEKDQAVATTCLYAVYDQTSGRCAVARAGHLPPIVVTPDGQADIVDVPAGPPLGLGGLPFECFEFDLAEGSLLALFTDGLVEAYDQDIDVGLRGLRDTLSASARTLEETCDRAVSPVVPGSSRDDAALLLAHVHRLSDSRVAGWDVPDDPAEVARCRALALEKVAAWDLEETAFVVELVVSELVTNALRYGGGPVRLRLIVDQALGLICEVSDGSHTSPHLRRVGYEEEGGRGLFLVAQLTERWGTRYGPSGKTIWCAVPFDGPKAP